MKLGTVLRILSVPLMLAGCSPQPGGDVHLVSGPESSGAVRERGTEYTGVVEGTVRKGPLLPMAQPGHSSDSGVAGARVDVATLDGKAVKSVETDSAGDFTLNLPAGTYEVTMPSLHGAMFTKDLPATITIVPGRKQRLDIVLDTGIR
jgi:hypothetical protein